LSVTIKRGVRDGVRMSLRKSFSTASFSAASLSAARQPSRPSGRREPGRHKPSVSTARHSHCILPLIEQDLVEMPLVAERRRAPTDPAGAGPAECLSPTPHGVVPDSWLMMIPRAASSSSTILRLGG
jgi:hypothetical protein